MSKNKEAVSKNLYYLLLMLIGEAKTLDAIKKKTLHPLIICTLMSGGTTLFSGKLIGQ